MGEVVGRGAGAIELNVLQYGVTKDALQDALAGGEGWDIVHFSGHGAPASCCSRTKLTQCPQARNNFGLSRALFGSLACHRGLGQPCHPGEDPGGLEARRTPCTGRC